MPTTDSREGDDDREAREEDGAARRAHRPADGLERVEVRVIGELRAEPRQDEQRVVDGDGQTDHDRQDRRRGAQRHEPAGRGDQPDAGADAQQRGQQGQAGGDEGPERDEQDDRRDRDADRLGCALLRDGLERRARRPRP